ncbi:hypothetical protein SPBRAN_779 [uncultured Candidatus Thioglobus sp.]|nr:hypothetical protein SPBRAN_779 [uncultured Candidatus Thioglobus sp.]
MCWSANLRFNEDNVVSVAGCLGYDVLAHAFNQDTDSWRVSVAGCLGYDVLGSRGED